METILSVDDEEPTAADIRDISIGNCTKCYAPYTLGSPVRFVRCGERLLWWHAVVKKGNNQYISSCPKAA